MGMLEEKKKGRGNFDGKKKKLFEGGLFLLPLEKLEILFLKYYI